MTRVDEWTKADTGVGAAIAAGSQAEKGIWALLVIAARIIKVYSKFLLNNSVPAATQNAKFISPPILNQAILMSKHTSPTRFLKTVSIPALLDFLEV